MRRSRKIFRGGGSERHLCFPGFPGGGGVWDLFSKFYYVSLNFPGGPEPPTPTLSRSAHKFGGIGTISLYTFHIEHNLKKITLLSTCKCTKITARNEVWKVMLTLKVLKMDWLSVLVKNWFINVKLKEDGSIRSN